MCCKPTTYKSCRDHCRGSLSIVSPVVRKSFRPSIIPAQTMDPRFDKNEPIFSIFVLPALLHMAADVHGFLDKAVDVFRDLGGAA